MATAVITATPAAVPPAAPPRRARTSLPAVLMRAGTSKGLFIHRAHLPPLEADWEAPLLAAMGSRYSDPSQLDGLGGATSVTSKVIVAGPSSRPGIDVDYTFVQVAVGKEKVDLSGNCGNMVSGVGPFAVQEGMVRAEPGARSVDVRIFNTNTEKVIVETMLVYEDGELVEEGTCMIPGVKGPGAPIKVAFVDPAGSMSAVPFPSGKRSESIRVEDVADLPPFDVDVTLVDIANPFVVVDERTLPLEVQAGDAGSPLNIEVAEAIRQRGAVRMGLAESNEEAYLRRGTPKLAIVSKPDAGAEGGADIRVQAYSMGKPHPSLQLTGGACLAGAACVEGTVLHRLARNLPKPVEDLVTPARTPSPSENGERDVGKGVAGQCSGDHKETVRIVHGRGCMEMEVWTKVEGDEISIERCIGIRTARRLFEGNVFYYI